MEFPRNPSQLERRTSPSRPRSRVIRKKNVVKRVASTLRRRRSQLKFIYSNALIEMAENKLNLPHEGLSGLIYAVPEIPQGHSRQSLLNGFDDVVANMSAAQSKSSSQRSWETASSEAPLDLLTGGYDNPEDFDRYLEPTELIWSLPGTPSYPKDKCLIDIDTPTTAGPPTPREGQSCKIDELFFGGCADILQTSLLNPKSNSSSSSLDSTLFPEPLKFRDSPYPVIESTKLAPSTSEKIQNNRPPHGNLRLDTQHPALYVTPSTPSVTSAETPNSAQSGRLIVRKPVPETPIRKNPPPAWSTPTKYQPYRPPLQELPSLSLPPVLTRPASSLFDEMNDEIDRVMASFDPSPVEPPTQTTLSPATSTPADHPLPPSHRIPTRTASRTAPTYQVPATPAPISLHSACSFRSRLGANTLAALLSASAEASPPSLLPAPLAPSSAAPHSWHKWIDRARDADSETEEEEHSRRWRERRRNAKAKAKGANPDRPPGCEDADGNAIWDEE